MKKLHFEFDAIVTDKDAEELLNCPEVIMEENIQFGLKIFDKCEYVDNLKITEPC